MRELQRRVYIIEETFFGVFDIRFKCFTASILQHFERKCKNRLAIGCGRQQCIWYTAQKCRNLRLLCSVQKKNNEKEQKS
jgi:hypothetical protein